MTVRRREHAALDGGETRLYALMDGRGSRLLRTRDQSEASHIHSENCRDKARILRVPFGILY